MMIRPYIAGQRIAFEYYILCSDERGKYVIKYISNYGVTCSYMRSCFVFSTYIIVTIPMQLL